MQVKTLSTNAVTANNLSAFFNENLATQFNLTNATSVSITKIATDSNGETVWLFQVK
jgi:hypothetical protein